MFLRSSCAIWFEMFDTQKKLVPEGVSAVQEQVFKEPQRSNVKLFEFGAIKTQQVKTFNSLYYWIIWVQAKWST